MNKKLNEYVLIEYSTGKLSELIKANNINEARKKFRNVMSYKDVIYNRFFIFKNHGRLLK